MDEIEKANKDQPDSSDSTIELADVRGVIQNRGTLYNGGLAIGVGLLFGSCLAPSTATMILGIAAGIIVLIWSAVNLVAQRSIFARATRLLSSGSPCQILRIRLHEPPRTRNTASIGSLYFLDKREHRLIAQGLGLHRIVGEQEVLFLEDETDPGFVVMKTSNGNCVLFLHPPFPGPPPTPEQNYLPKL
ncbi:MAG: hypothetical protein K2W95_29645 [Candidatus Obscuribacterales bacterium]|nr:hypothetical protein [Candidatus Obscuribacterales bacterium]